MRTPIILAVASLAVMLSAAPQAANAITLSAPAALGQSGEATNPIEQVRLVCRSYWNGYRWRQRCYNTTPYYSGRRYYRPYRYGYYRPYYRPYRYW